MKQTNRTPVHQKIKMISKLPYGGNSRAVIEDKPRPKIQRPPSNYSNRSVYGIATEVLNKKQIQ